MGGQRATPNTATPNTAGALRSRSLAKGNGLGGNEEKPNALHSRSLAKGNDPGGMKAEPERYPDAT